MIKVTCAIIEQQGLVLVTQRSETMALPLLWEFPGGKLEDGETEEACLIREIQEELSLNITTTQRLTPVLQQDVHKIIELIPFICQYNNGVIHLAEHRAYHWVNTEDLKTYDWCPADVPVVAEYLQLRQQQV
ncbi:NUDIX hydrolase [Pontibacter sp. HJ8]